MEQFKPKYNIEEWKGKRFGHLEIIGQKRGVFVCKCDCGNFKDVKPAYLFNKKVSTCGLDCMYHKEKNHGFSRTRLYTIWSGMKARCYNPNFTGYYIYGGRGISVCDEWRNNFFSFQKWALENGYNDELTIDRIDGDGNYEPANCRWATYKQQAANQHPPYTFVEKPTQKRFHGKKFEAFGESKPLAEWCSLYGLSRPMVEARLKRGMSLEMALSTKKQRGIPLCT